MSADPEDAARTALRERLGSGARYDSPYAPARELLWVRRGTAYFARALSLLSDDELDAPSLLPGWSRRHVVAHVGYNARALSRLVEWARTGVETPMYASPEQRAREIELGATLPTRALRSLFDHAEVHLNVEWRDLDDFAWESEVRTALGRLVPVRETPWMRTREVWVHAVDLDSGASFRDFPPDLLDEMLRDVVRAWSRRSEPVALTLALTDRAESVVIGGGAGASTVTGATADVVRWLTGRGGQRLESSTGSLPAIPGWF